MPTSPTEPADRSLILLVEPGESGSAWRLLDGISPVAHGRVDEAVPLEPARHILAVPGEQVALHWIDLEKGLTRAQAAAAARLILADRAAEPMADLHVAIGRAEDERVPVALVSRSAMAQWIADATDAGLSIESMIPTGMLLAPPEQGAVARRRGALVDYRGRELAFTTEEEVGALVAGEPIRELDDADYEAALPALLADPPIDLRQGDFAVRREGGAASRRARRIGILFLLFALISLAVQVAAILTHVFAADRLRSEADQLLAASAGGGRAIGFSNAATALFAAVQGSTGVEMVSLDFREGEGLRATLMADDPVNLAPIAPAVEARGLSARSGTPRSAGGRVALDLALGAR